VLGTKAENRRHQKVVSSRIMRLGLRTHRSRFQPSEADRGHRSEQAGRDREQTSIREQGRTARNPPERLQAWSTPVAISKPGRPADR